MRTTGTIARGIRCPIIREGDDLVRIVTSAVLAAANNDHFELHDHDVIGITESIVARAQGNYATIDDIAEDIHRKMNGGTIGIVMPMLSRNRFAICLKGIAAAADKIVLMFNLPCDEVGNELVSIEELEQAGFSITQPFCFGIEYYRHLFGNKIHLFTGIDYVQYYYDLITSTGTKCEIFFSNCPEMITNYADKIIVCSTHNREYLISKLQPDKHYVCGLDDILSYPVNNSGYNPYYGLLGSNKVSETKIKLFPRDGQQLVELIQKELYSRSGKKIEVMIYGDGAFKDPIGHIWELADPVVSPAYTPGLDGTPNEVKIKYLADNQFANLNGVELQEAISNTIREKDKDLTAKMISEGTTPRHLTDLIGSLCDLISGSGDKGTPVVLIQGYFDNYSND